MAYLAYRLIRPWLYLSLGKIYNRAVFRYIRLVITEFTVLVLILLDIGVFALMFDRFRPTLAGSVA